ncbi:phosphoenolpyruvate synthase [Moritella sp. 36]|uniref:phosphoenolpyruvate synthase n=1 Tax=Moritella sp. 36 TaxID=2746233 RepID=UPI001BAD6A24|nr:phosphoenolpyruvate synthase [Moritella sp. 36]QUM89821.1 phosphoenolpyruvate synthase [Moritella sp. 36]
MTTKYILDAVEAAQVDTDLLGGKAENLALLTRNGFTVPKWWVLTTQGFSTQLEQLGIKGWVEAKVKLLAGEENNKVIAGIAQEIQAEIGKQQLNDEIIQGIRSSIPDDVLANTSFAVRSSVVGEDAEGASFAGQMDSYLYQSGENAIFTSIIKVMQSAFNHRALAYRIQKGLDLSDIRAAVIIQEMVDADVAGVMFTAQPITGSRQHALISSTWGCGEGIVSGICNTDETTVALYNDDVDTIINDKDTALIFDAGGTHGTTEVPVDDGRRNIACLEKQQILVLRDIGLKIAESYQMPQDIEWCLKDGHFYILQTRPITSLPPINAATDDVQVWDNSNIQESYCGVTTPLTFSFANRAYKHVYEQTFRLLGISEKVVQENQDMLNNMLGLINGRVYYNINNWYLGLQFLPSFKTNKADMERMMGLTDPVDMIQDKQLSFNEKLKKVPQIFKALFALLGRYRKMDTLVAEFRTRFQQVYSAINREQLHTLTIGQLINKSKQLDADIFLNWTSPIVNDFYVMTMNGKVHRWLEKVSVEYPDVVQNNLLSGEEGIESTEPTKFLLRMCGYLRQHEEMKNLVLEGENSKLLGLIQTRDPQFYSQCMDYIERFGDRTIGELKLESITLRQDSSFMFAILKNFLANPDLSLESLAKNESKFRKEAEELVYPLIESKLGRRSLRKFKTDLGKLRDAIRNRENMRLARTRAFGLFRSIYLEIGEQLAFYGKIDEPRDIFFLSIEEIYAYKEGRSIHTKLDTLIAPRKQEFASYEASDLPHHFWTKGAVYCNNVYEYPHQDEDLDLNSEHLKGTGCYPGVVEKNIRLIFSPDDELSLDGQILCTVRTDPGWAPLFPTAGGIIVERGSTLSHSAVVARELGIPAIVGVPNLTKILTDHEKIRMDGTSGKIERIEVSDND